VRGHWAPMGAEPMEQWMDGLLPSQFNILAMAKTIFVFLTLLQIQVLNKNLTDNLGDDNPSLQYELK